MDKHLWYPQHEGHTHDSWPNQAIDLFPSKHVLAAQKQKAGQSTMQANHIKRWKPYQILSLHLLITQLKWIVNFKNELIWKHGRFSLPQVRSNKTIESFSWYIPCVFRSRDWAAKSKNFMHQSNIHEMFNLIHECANSMKLLTKRRRMHLPCKRNESHQIKLWDYSLSCQIQPCYQEHQHR